MVTFNRLTTMDRIKITLEVLDKLKRDVVNLKPDEKLEVLNEINATFKVTRHGLEMDIRRLLEEQVVFSEYYRENLG